MVIRSSSGGEPFSRHRFADLVVDRVYGLRQTRLVGLRSSGTNPNWPDTLDVSTGTVTYYGDTRQPGADLHQTPKHGNLILRQTFDLAHGDAAARSAVPPYFYFEKAGPGREVIFRGVLAPGAPELTADEDLVAVWRSQDNKRFQNYRAKFTVLDISVATRAWIDDSAGNPLSANCPQPWQRWVAARHYQALTAARDTPPQATSHAGLPKPSRSGRAAGHRSLLSLVLNFVCRGAGLRGGPWWRHERWDRLVKSAGTGGEFTGPVAVNNRQPGSNRPPLPAAG